MGLSVTDKPEAGALGRELVKHLSRLTWERHGELGLDNARRNTAWLARGQSIKALRGASLGKADHAVIIAAGPSIKRKDPIRLLKQRGYTGAVICTESALAYCLRNGVVPDLTLSLDPHATRIVRWFGDPKLSQDSLQADDYFSRQDMDDALRDEMRANDELLKIMADHGAKIRIALATSAPQAVVERVFDIGMDVYWWNPMYDDPDMPDSVTAALQRENGLPCVNAGGNVGSAAWMVASAVLGKPRVALTGIDFSYYAGTPYAQTQYYREALALVGEENLDSLYIRVFNPHTRTWFFTDPAYYWYRDCLLEMVRDAECETFNCTEGGIVFGDGIHFIPFEDFLTRCG